MASTQNITIEQLEQLDAKILFAALEKKLASAGMLQKKRGKKAAASSSSASDAASDAGSTRSVGEGTKAWNELTKSVSGLVKTALDGEKGGAGFHLKVLSYLKNEKGLAAGQTPSLELVKEAVAYLKKNADYKTPNQKNKEEKSSSAPAAAKVDSDSEESEAEEEKPAPKPVEKKKAGRPKMSEEEKAAKKEAKKAEKKEAKKEEKEEKKPKKEVKKFETKKPVPVPEPEPEEEEEAEMEAIEIDGEQVFWNQSTGEVFENIEGAMGDLVGTFDGITLNRA